MSTDCVRMQPSNQRSVQERPRILSKSVFLVYALEISVVTEFYIIIIIGPQYSTYDYSW